MLLVTNGRDRQPAVYGKIRVLADGERLPRALPEHAAAGRLLAAYLDRPLIPDNFSAPRSLDPWSGRCLDDWETFYQGGTRLVEYLNHAGYNGLMLAVLADGSTIYPSALLEPTPRYDTGALFASAQDPVRKDVLEMLLRLFDREDLQLIPTVEFAAPLPELEAMRRRGGPDAEGIEWIGPEGTGWCASWPPRRGLAPYYNLLHPRVQQAMLGVLRELAARYAGHPAFAGLAVRLSADGYAQLPGPDWGLDDATIARFQRDTNLQVPGNGPRRFAQRATFLARTTPPPGVAGVAGRPTRPVLPPRRRGTGRAAARQPALPGRRRHDRRAGAGGRTAPRTAAPNHHGRHAAARGHRPPALSPTTRRTSCCCGPSALRRRPIWPAAPPISKSLKWRTSTAAFRPPRPAGSLFFHPPRQVRIESFDQKSPFKPSATWLVSQPVPAGPAEPAAVRPQPGHARLRR